MLTPREEEIVKLVAEAHTNDEIAEMLFISKKTVERHRANILEKLGMRDRVELTRYAIRRGLVQPWRWRRWRTPSPIGAARPARSSRRTHCHPRRARCDGTCGPWRTATRRQPRLDAAPAPQPTATRDASMRRGWRLADVH